MIQYEVLPREPNKTAHCQSKKICGLNPFLLKCSIITFACLIVVCCCLFITLGVTLGKNHNEDQAAIASCAIDRPGNQARANQTMCKLQLCVDSSVTPRLLAEHWRQTTLERSIDNAMIAWQYSGEVVQLSAPRDELVYESPKGLVDVATKAYSQHHDLVLRPDDVWQAILTQFSFYVIKNSKTLRDRFVDFQGKRKLTVTTLGTLYTVDFGELAERMVDEQIVDNIRDPTIAEWILPGFTTTTENDRIVASVTMMATLQNYFEYEFELTCGLSSITLLGSIDDWKMIRQKVNRLKEFDNEDGNMTKWYELLTPVLDELIKTKSGINNRNFWQKICHFTSYGCGSTLLSGWITVFAAFDQHGNWVGDKRYDVPSSKWPVIDLSDLPSGIVSVPVSINDNGIHYDAHMMAGQFAFDGEGTSMQPRSDWCIAIDQPAT